MAFRLVNQIKEAIISTVDNLLTVITSPISGTERPI
jgi:hypothetical protein